MTNNNTSSKNIDENDIDNWDEDPETLSNEELIKRIAILDKSTKIIEATIEEVAREVMELYDDIDDNESSIAYYNKPPYLVASIREILEAEPDELEDPEAFANGEMVRKVIVRASTRVSFFLPHAANLDDLEVGELVGVDKTTKTILTKLPNEYDPRVKVMEVDEKPKDKYSDIGGLDKQVAELVEAIVLPITHKENFDSIGITPPKGVLMYGPPGTGKTLLARACASETDACFLKLAGPQLVQTYIGDGARLVREAFDLAREKAPTIIFIDELDSIGTKRSDSEKAGDREVKRTMLELLNQLDGFSSTDDIKVIAATNRIDVLDPALLRSGRLDRKIEFPLPNADGRISIMKIHSKGMPLDKDVNFEEIAGITEGFNGAECKAICIEAAMVALRKDNKNVTHEDMIDAIAEVQAKKKVNVNYYS